MKVEHPDLRQEKTFVAEVQIVFQNGEEINRFSAGMNTLQNKPFAYTRTNGALVSTLDAQCESQEEASEILSRIWDAIYHVIKSKTIAWVCIGRVYHVLESIVALEPKNG